MSIDISWPTLTSGPDGDRLAAQIRDFIHDKFQQVALPRFIQSVQVHSFDFGTVAPDVELKDIGDPLGDFYEGSDGSDGGEEDGESEDEEGGWMRRKQEEDEDIYMSSSRTTLRATQRADNLTRSAAAAVADTSTTTSTLPHPPPAYHDSFRPPNLRTSATSTSTEPALFSPPPLPYRSPTPIAPGGTSTLNHYFHSPLTTGLSGTQTPLAAVAGAHLPSGWPEHGSGSVDGVGVGAQRQDSTASVESLSPPSTANSSMSARTQSEDPNATAPHSTPPPLRPSSCSPPNTHRPPDPHRRRRIPRPSDFQVIARVRYTGNISLSLTAMILLDYPMPSFVGIPIKLNITGLSFDGVAVLAFTRKKNVHFCFLAHEDAVGMVGGDDVSVGAGGGGLLKEIKVESEIGQREGGKQSLKNVGKVEKFVLEQVRRIFEEEFVYPSFWTFLV
ncbi:MAG: Mitochondrial distribution and morphology protein 12 [Geoglossum umbratile]|nr:MAG: Mitochondrial distribution and morphology protein 12 [Geoglossum umbratile]